MSYLNDAEWKRARKKVITATEAGAILGLNPWLTGNRVWKQKNNGEFIPTSYVIMGQVLEKVVVELTNKVLKTKFELFENEDNFKLFAIDESGKLGATPDARDGQVLLECKTTGPRNFNKWQECPPLYYVLQLQVQLMCMNLREGWLSIMSTDLTPKDAVFDPPILVFQVVRDDWIHETLVSEVKRFWKTVKAGKSFRANKLLGAEVAIHLLLSITRAHFQGDL